MSAYYGQDNFTLVLHTQLAVTVDKHSCIEWSKPEKEKDILCFLFSIRPILIIFETSSYNQMNSYYMRKLSLKDC